MTPAVHDPPAPSSPSAASPTATGSVAVQLCRSLSASLHADAAVISVTVDELRAPLAASTAAAETAEALEFTLGAGPCVDAAASGRVIIADGARLGFKWPLFQAQLTRRTMYGSVAAVPLPDLRTGRGALHLYYEHPQGVDTLNVEIATLAAQAVATVVCSATWDATSRGAARSSWLNTDGVRRRADVWIAVGMLTAALDVSEAGGLALLRGYAADHDLDVDTVAELLLTGAAQPSQLAPRR